MDGPGPRSSPAVVLRVTGASSIGKEVCAEFPAVVVEVGAPPTAPALRVRAGPWLAGEIDPAELDGALAGGPPWMLELDASGCAARPATRAALEVLTRTQRVHDRRNEHSAGPLWDRVLDRHRALHDLEKPLVAADHAHALDTWQWVLRLDPGAGTALQAAALFHDVERLVSEADARVEQHAPDYDVFKERHARGSAIIAVTELACCGLDDAELHAVSALIAGHEEGGVLADADALSFFSLNSGGFADYYGPEHARRKIGWTLARMSAGALRRLAWVRLRADVLRLLEEIAPAGAPA